MEFQQKDASLLDVYKKFTDWSKVVKYHGFSYKERNINQESIFVYLIGGWFSWDQLTCSLK